MFWKACVYSVQGDQEAAIAALEEGLQKGVWWNPLVLTYDEDLKVCKQMQGLKNRKRV